MSAQKKAPSEMRRKVRVAVSGVICVTDRQTGRRLGQLANLSEDGLMLLATEPLAENSIFQLSLGFCDPSGESDPIELGAECLWCHASSNQTQFWAGFYIIDISGQNQERIRQLTG